MQLSGDVRHVCGFNGALQSVEGRGTVALKGEAAKQVLVLDVLYVPGVHANLLSAGQLKENGVKLQDDGGEMLLVSSAGDVLGRARYSGRILCTGLRPCSTKSTMTLTEVVALRTIAYATNLTSDLLHARLAHVGVDTIKSSAKHEVAAGLDIKKSIAADLPCASCAGGKLARHTFPDRGSDAENALDVVHIDLCGPFRVAANDCSLYFLLLKDRKTRYVWVRPIAKKSDVLVVFEKWLKEVEWQMSKTVKKLCSDRGGEFLGHAFTDLVEDKGILHNLTCPYTPQQNGMAEREMRMVVEAFMVPEQQHGGKLASKARWGLHLSVSPESKGWEVLDLTDNKIITKVEAIFNETLSLEMWKVEYGPTSTGTPSAPPTNSSSEMPPLLINVDEHDDEDVEEVSLPPPIGPSSAAGDEGRLGELSASKLTSRKPSAEVPPAEKPTAEKPLAKAPPAGEPSAEKPILQELSVEELPTGEQFDDDSSSDDVVEVIGAAGGGEGEQTEDDDVVEVVVEKEKP
ncbi:unnamed protein product [Closterium sp. NIES-53]